MLDTLEKPLSKDMIIEMNKILKRGTSDEDNPRYNIGGFKIVPNIIGLVEIVKTSNPQDVENDLNQLLKEYKKLDKITIEDIIHFHVLFERIHPFSDGNGRVGRMIMFRECLRNDIMPFIILDKNKDYYIKGLKDYDRDSKYLIDTCLYAQDIYESVSNQLLDFEIDE